MGLVYRAYHPELERTGAVKVLQAITPDVDTVARFRHEAQAIAQLRHPNIVNVYDFGAFQGTPYMIVEYIPGGSLAARMARGRLDQATALKYLRGIAAGLDYAHSHGVVHRDVKPANVLLASDDTPVLADFGLAKLLQGSSLKSMTGVTTGTPAYMAPEQVAGHQVGPAADRYSLATIAYEMLTGVIPFDGEALMELLYAQVHRQPPAPSSRLPTLSPNVDAVLLRGLAKDPAARWESATAFVDALALALYGAPSPAYAETMVAEPELASTVPIAGPAVERRSQPVPIPARAPASVPAAKPGRRRRGRVLIGVAAVLVLLLALGVCSVLAQATTLTVSPSRAARGDTVTVSATNVPANQAGEIQLWSLVYAYPFRSDSSGNVRVYMTVPRDIALGDHEVKICWSNACHKQAPLRIVASLAEVLPTARATPSQTPGSPPPPSSQPSSQPTSPPTSRPTPPPRSPSPTPPPTPKPSPSPPSSVTLVSVSSLLNTTVTFHYFYGGSTVAYVCQGGMCRSAGNVTVAAGPNVNVTFKTPLGILAAPVGGPAYVYTDCCGGTNSVAVGA